MPQQADTECHPEIAPRVDAVRAQYKKKIDRVYASYAGSRGKRTWSETVAAAGRLERESEAQVNAILTSALTSARANEGSTADDSPPASPSPEQLGEAGAETHQDKPECKHAVNGEGSDSAPRPSNPDSESDGQETGSRERKRGRRSRKQAKAEDPRRVTEQVVREDDANGAAVVVPLAVAPVVSLDDPSLQSASLAGSATKLLKELVGNYRAAIHQVVKTGKLANPPGAGATKDQWKEAAHALFNLWMTRSIASQDAALERISQWEKSLTGALQNQLQSLLFGVRSPERERLVEPYDFVFRRVRSEKVRITALMQREHEQFQGTLQGALRKRIAAIDADSSIPSEKKRGRRASVDQEEEVSPI